MPGQWENLNVNLKDISSGFADYARREKEKTDAFQALIFKSAIEMKMKEMAMQKNLELLRGMGFGLSGQPPEGSVMPGTEPSIKPQDYETIVEPKLSEEGGLSFGFQRKLTPEAEITRKKEAEIKQTTKKSIGEFRGFVKQFERSYDELISEHPSIGNIGIKGFGTRLLGEIKEKTGYFPETSAFLRELKPMANQMARTIEGGRVTDQDRKIYADSFANVLGAPSATNSRLMANTLVSAYNKGGNISTILKLFSESDNVILQDVLNKVNQEIPQLDSQNKDFKNMSNEDLINKYMKKYPNRSREEIIRAMQK